MLKILSHDELEVLYNWHVSNKKTTDYGVDLKYLAKLSKGLTSRKAKC